MSTMCYVLIFPVLLLSKKYYKLKIVIFGIVFKFNISVHARTFQEKK